MMGNFMKFCSDEPLDVLMNPHRDEEEDRARAAGAVRLQALGVRLTGTESSEEIGDLLDGVEWFEEAVESRGGDLMVDEPPRGHVPQPDAKDFVLPIRGDGESVADFVAKLTAAATRARHHPAVD
jgi:hypothetical protein